MSLTLSPYLLPLTTTERSPSTSPTTSLPLLPLLLLPSAVAAGAEAVGAGVGSLGSVVASSC